MISRRKFLKLILGVSTTLFTLNLTNFSPKLAKQVDKSKVKKIDSNLPKQFTPRAIEDIKALANNDLQGREAGTTGEVLAAQYLTKQLYFLNIKPLGSVGYQHIFTIPALEKTYSNNRLVFIRGKEERLKVPCANIIGEITGRNNDEIILLCAHYDHLGKYMNKVYKGANDNASGVACILDVIRLLKRDGTPNKRIVVAFWSAEEMGFLGSKAFIHQPTFPISKIKAVVNIDTVGNGKTGEFSCWADDDNFVVNALRSSAESYGSGLSRVPYNNHNSDQSTFAKLGIPAVSLMAKEWLKNNHTPNDTPERINVKQLNLATKIVYKTIKALC